MVEHREEITHYNLVQAIKSMKGIAMEKYHAMEHHYPSRMEWINKFSYDPKQLHYLLRVEEYIHRYISGESYVQCLIPRNQSYLKDVKCGCHSLDEARLIAKKSIDNIAEMCEQFLKECSSESNSEVDKLLDDVQYNIMMTAIKTEILRG